MIIAVKISEKLVGIQSVPEMEKMSYFSATFSVRTEADKVIIESDRVSFAGQYGDFEIDAAGDGNSVTPASAAQAAELLSGFVGNFKSGGSGGSGGGSVSPDGKLNVQATLWNNDNGAGGALYSSLTDWFQNHAGEKGGLWEFPDTWPDLPVTGQPYIIWILHSHNAQGSKIYTLLAFNRSGNMRTDRGTYIESTGSLTWACIVSERTQYLPAMNYASLAAANLPLQRLVGLKTASSFFWVYRFGTDSFMYFGANLDTPDNSGKPAMETGLIGPGGSLKMLYPTLEQLQTLMLVNYPNQWTPDQEYDFGNGLYGKRITGTVTANIGAVSTINIVAGATTGIVDSGGEIGLGETGTKVTVPVGQNGWNADMTLSFNSHPVRNIDTGEINLISQSSHNRLGNANSVYDAWVKYTK